MKIETIIFTALLSTCLLGQSQTNNLNVSDHRPLAAALDELEHRAGLAINYEDPQYVLRSDLDDVATPAQKNDSPNYQLLVPKKGTLQLSLASMDLEGKQADRLLALHALLGHYKDAGFPGQFKVVEHSGAIYVIPTAKRSKTGDGAEVEFSSVMETKITIPYQRRRVVDTLDAIAQSLSMASGVKVAIGNSPLPLVQMVAFGADGIAAREALSNLLSGLTSAPISYRLLYDPMGSGYMLNLQVVKGMAPTKSQTIPIGSSQETPAANRFFDPVPKKN